MFIRNTLSTLTSIVVNLTRSTWTCILVLLVESLKRISKDRPRRRLDHQERSTMFDKVILVVVVVDIIYLVDHDRVFLEASNALKAIKIYALTCTSDLFQSLRTFLTLVQTCIVCYALGGISKACGVCGRYRFVEAPSLFILPFLSFVPNSFVPNSFILFLFSLIDCVVRLNTIMDIIAWFERLYIVYWQEESKNKRRIGDEIICHLTKIKTSKWTPSISVEINE